MTTPIVVDFIDVSVPGKLKIYAGNSQYNFDLHGSTATDGATAFQIIYDTLNKSLAEYKTSIIDTFKTELAKQLSPTSTAPVLPTVDPSAKLNQLQVSANGNFTDINTALSYANSGAQVVFDEGMYILPLTAHPRLEIALVCFDPVAQTLISVMQLVQSNPTGPTAPTGPTV